MKKGGKEGVSPCAFVNKLLWLICCLCSGKTQDESGGRPSWSEYLNTCYHRLINTNSVVLLLG